MSQPHLDLTRTTLFVLFLGSLLAATFWVMRPFLLAILWAATLVVATWPLMLRVQHYAGNRRSLAVLVMTLALLLVLILPFWLAISTILSNLDQITELARTILSFRVPPPPHWLADTPLVGSSANRAWGQLTASGVQDLTPRLTPYAGQVTEWLAAALGSLGTTFLQFLLTIGIAAVLYARGERAAAFVLRFGHRLGGARGEAAVRLAGLEIRGVALGVVVTALVQSVIGGIGLAVVGLSFAPVLTSLMFVLCLAQLGPGPVLFPAMAWVDHSSGTLWGTALLVFVLVALAMDSVLRPMLIRRGADLPLLLIIAGVVGGLMAIGLLGIFLGPTVLAAAYTLGNAWMDDSGEAEPPTVPQ